MLVCSIRLADSPALTLRHGRRTIRTGDTLGRHAVRRISVPPSATFTRPGVWRDTTSGRPFFGEGVGCPTAADIFRPSASLTEIPLFKVSSLLLAATYAMLLYRNLGDVRLLLDRVSRDRATGQRLSGEPGGSDFSRFLNIATTIGMLFMGGHGRQIRGFPDAWAA